MAGRLIDGIDRIVPWWLSYRPKFELAAKYLWTSALMCDALIHALLEGIQAAWPGRGTPTALREIGATRGIVRGLSDTDEEYAARLRGWLDRYRRMGSDEAIARALHEYLLSRPMVRVVDRHGQWTEIDTVGNLRTFTAPWDWDSVSHPNAATERPTDIWVIVYGAAYQHVPDWTALDPGYGLGHNVPVTESDQAIALLKQWKNAHNFVRCVIWVDDPSELDPESNVGLPDGQWGYWSKDDGSGNRIPSRNLNFRYWEFDQL
jgi:hypothetical protein